MCTVQPQKRVPEREQLPETIKERIVPTLPGARIIPVSTSQSGREFWIYGGFSTDPQKTCLTEAKEARKSTGGLPFKNT